MFFFWEKFCLNCILKYMFKSIVLVFFLGTPNKYLMDFLVIYAYHFLPSTFNFFVSVSF